MGIKISRLLGRRPKKTVMEKARPHLQIPMGYRLDEEGNLEQIPLHEMPSLRQRMQEDARASGGDSHRLTHNVLVGDYFHIIQIKNRRRRKHALKQFRINHPHVYNDLHRHEDDPPKGIRNFLNLSPKPNKRSTTSSSH